MIEVRRNGYGIHIAIREKGGLSNLTPDEARELIHKLQTVLAPPPQPSAWMVVPSTPGMPLETIELGTGVNLIPCELWVAEQAVNHSSHADLRTGLFSLGEAFELAWQQRTHETAYIVDHGDGTYTVAL